MDCSDAGDAGLVRIELFRLGSDDVSRSVINRNATLGQLSAKLDAAALEKYDSNERAHSYRNAAIVLISPGSMARVFKLSEVDTEFMTNRDVHACLLRHRNEPLRFQLLRLKSPAWTMPWKGKIYDWYSLGKLDYLEEIVDVFNHTQYDLVRAVNRQPLFTARNDS